MDSISFLTYFSFRIIFLSHGFVYIHKQTIVVMTRFLSYSLHIYVGDFNYQMRVLEMLLLTNDSIQKCLLLSITQSCCFYWDFLFCFCWLIFSVSFQCEQIIWTFECKKYFGKKSQKEWIWDIITRWVLIVFKSRNEIMPLEKLGFRMSKRKLSHEYGILDNFLFHFQ